MLLPKQVMSTPQLRAHLRLLEILPKHIHERKPPPQKLSWSRTVHPEIIEEKQREIRVLHSQGFRQVDIAKKLNLSEPTVSRYLNWKR